MNERLQGISAISTTMSLSEIRQTAPNRFSALTKSY